VYCGCLAAVQAATGQAVLGGAPLWHPSCLSGFVGVSGAYDLEGLAAHLHRRGLYKNLLDTIMSIDSQVGWARAGCRTCSSCCSADGTCLPVGAAFGVGGLLKLWVLLVNAETCGCSLG
jgi:hypothetical protein